MLEVFGVNVIDPGFYLLPIIGALMITFGLKLRRDTARAEERKALAARYAGFHPQDYAEKLESREDCGDVLLRGITNHQEALLRRGEAFLHSIGQVRHEDLLKSMVGIENLLNKFFFACYMQNKDDLPKIRRQLMWMRQNLDGEVKGYAEFNEHFKKGYKLWLEELWEWEEIMLMLEPHFNIPPERLDL